MQSFIQPVSHQQLSVSSYYAPGNVPSAGEPTVNKTATILTLPEFPSQEEDADVKQISKMMGRSLQEKKDRGMVRAEGKECLGQGQCYLNRVTERAEA